MKICCISDTHERHRQLEIPACDLLIHAGDMTMMGVPSAIRDFNDWCLELLENGVAKIVVIAGNHDFLFQNNPEMGQSLLTASTYLLDGGMSWEGKLIWGTPWQPWFYDWAFNLRTEKELEEKFARIPARTDILVCHGPPKGILDRTQSGDSVGSIALLSKIREIGVKVVVFGHIHEGYGTLKLDGKIFANASICDVHYRAVNRPILIDLP